jgi:hypothetical protein
MVDYSFHQIITDASDDVIFREVPEVVASGIRSLKVFLTYDPLHLDDRQFLRVLAAARRTGALVTVHCENYEASACQRRRAVPACHGRPECACPSVLPRSPARPSEIPISDRNISAGGDNRAAFDHQVIIGHSSGSLTHTPIGSPNGTQALPSNRCNRIFFIP